MLIILQVHNVMGKTIFARALIATSTTKALQK